MKRMGIATRLSTIILIGAILTLALVVCYSYQASRRGMIAQAETQAKTLARATAARIDTIFQRTATVTDTLAGSMEDTSPEQGRILDLQRKILGTNPDLYGTAMAFEPYTFDPARRFYAPYTFRRNGQRVSTILGSDSYQYSYMDWYQLARELKRPIWTEPYFDDGLDHALMITHATPFFRYTSRGRKVAGVVTADITLDWLRDLISSIQVYSSGYVFLLSRYGTYIAHPDPSLPMNETIFTHAEDTGQQALHDLGRRMVEGRSGFDEFDDLPGTGPCYVAYVPLPEEKWSVGVVLPKAELLADLTHLTHVMIGLGIVGALLLAGLVLQVSRSITRPLRLLTEAAGHIASGDLDRALPTIATGDEVGMLAESFTSMKQALKRHIADLTSTTAAKERIESELRIAHDIQMGILPKIFPAFPDRREIDIFASIVPAREVGGDLYDFFFIDDHRLCFLVGDVSGKGVPAAFFMAVTKTLVKAVAERTPDPGRILVKVNDDLAADNPSCMFVTIFLAVLDLHTGELQHASAGHNPPVLLDPDNGPQWLPGMDEPMAGAMPDMEYTTGHLHLRPGQSLVLYTDGVTEAMSEQDSLYGEDRLLHELERLRREGAIAITNGVFRSVREFAGLAEQSDDITLLVLRYLGPATL